MDALMNFLISLFFYTSFETRNFINSKAARTLLKKYCSQAISLKEFDEMKDKVIHFMLFSFYVWVALLNAIYYIESY